MHIGTVECTCAYWSGSSSSSCIRVPVCVYGFFPFFSISICWIKWKRRYCSISYNPTALLGSGQYDTQFLHIAKKYTVRSLILNALIKNINQINENENSFGFVVRFVLYWIVSLLFIPFVSLFLSFANGKSWIELLAYTHTHIQSGHIFMQIVKPTLTIWTLK